MLVGLQGSGKTTTCAKIGKRLTDRDKKKVLMASLDTRRPAAQEQLRVLGEQTGVDTLPIVAGQTPQQIARRALDAGRLGGYDVVLLDTAGRTHIDDELMRESADIRDIAKPHETLLVADSLTGQDAVNLARSFDERVGITGIVLTRVDGDGRGGAALSMRAVTGKPIKLIGVGESWDALEDFHPQRIAGRILGMGDVVSLVEKAAQTIDAEKAQEIAQKMRKGEFDLEDLGEQLKQMQKMGGMGGMMGMLPGVGKIKQQMAAADIDDRVIKRQRAIISSMTPKERRNPKVLDGKRKRRIAAGSGTKLEEVNKLLKMHRQMADMMKMMGKNKGMMQRMAGAWAWAAARRRARPRWSGCRPSSRVSIPRRWSSCRRRCADGGCRRAAACRVSAAPMPTSPGLPGLGGGVPRFPAFRAFRERRSSDGPDARNRAAADACMARGRPSRRSPTFCADEATARFIGGACGREDAWRRMAMSDRPLGVARLRPWVLEEKASGDWSATAACGTRKAGRSRSSCGACAPQARAVATRPRRRCAPQPTPTASWAGRRAISCIAPANLPSRASPTRSAPRSKRQSN